jgi:hypothetical protein
VSRNSNTINTINAQSRICETYVAVGSSPDLVERAGEGEVEGRTVWAWKDESSGRLDVEKDKKKRDEKLSVVVRFCPSPVSNFSFSFSFSLHAYQAPHIVSKIYAPNDLPTRVLLVSPSGALSITDTELNLTHTTHTDTDTDTDSHGHLKELIELIECFMFARKGCSFFPARGTIAAIVLVLVLRIGNTTRVRVLAVVEDAVEEVGTSDLDDVSPDVSPQSQLSPRTNLFPDAADFECVV